MIPVLDYVNQICPSQVFDPASSTARSFRALHNAHAGTVLILYVAAFCLPGDSPLTLRSLRQPMSIAGQANCLGRLS